MFKKNDIAYFDCLKKRDEAAGEIQSRGFRKIKTA
jgi:hypothetical protein